MSLAAAQLIPIDIPIPPKPSDNQKIVTYKFSVCTEKKIEIANTMKPTMAIKPLETNLDCPCVKFYLKSHQQTKLKINMINQGNELIVMSLNST